MVLCVSKVLHHSTQQAGTPDASPGVAGKQVQGAGAVMGAGRATSPGNASDTSPAAAGAPPAANSWVGSGSTDGSAPCPGGPVIVELTDGWYRIRAVLDGPIGDMAAAGNIQARQGSRCRNKLGRRSF